jgi:exodeoxyribonuclease VII small subunit
VNAAASASGPQPEELTFEQGYEQLKQIADRLDHEDVPVHEMCALFARGKGLEQVLRAFLTEQQGQLEAIERGENLPEFRIVAPRGDPSAGRTAEAAGTIDPASAAQRLPSEDEDIPF